MKVVIVSDTHSRHDRLEIPEGDLLVVAGDLTSRGGLGEVEAFDRFLATLPHPHKVVIAGNHDFCFERNPTAARARLRHAIYLEDQGCVLEGVSIWGSPWQPWYNDWAFNLPRGSALRARWDLIPDEVDLLVTHGPPYGIGDRTYDGRLVGCEQLLERLHALRPQVHCFGHIHEAYGVYRKGQTLLVNASTCDIRYRPINPPVVVELKSKGI